MANALKELTEVTSQLHRGLEAYLQAFVDLSAWKESPAFLFLPDRIRDAAEELYQQPEVVNWTTLDQKTKDRRAEADARGEFGRGTNPPRTTPWVEERDKVKRALILGRPGEGKTLLTRLTCREVAEKSLELLKAQTCSVAEIPIPIWIRFEDLLMKTIPDRTRQPGEESRPDPLQAAVDATVPGAVAKAVTKFFKGNGDAPSPLPASTHIRHALGRPSTWLFIDALDELGKDASEGADVNRAAALLPLAALDDAHVVMTCRTHEYDESGILPQAFAKGWVAEYELEPLASAQQRAFLQTWFGDSPKASEVETLLDSHPQFQDMATNGLMLTLICATAERHKVSKETRRVELYEKMLRDMVGRARRPNPIKKRSPIIGYRLGVLREVAWSFFAQHPDTTSLGEGEWGRRLSAAGGTLLLDFPTFEPDMREAGLLVSHEDGFLRFLHRSFFEYLAGARMACAGSGEIVSMVRAHLEDSAWREALIMAVGYLGLIRPEPGEAGAVVDQILTDPPGSAGLAIVLMGDAVADGGDRCVPAETLVRLRDALLGVMRNDAIPPKTRAAAGTALGRVGDHRFHDESLWCLPKDELLGFVEIPEGEFWMGSDT